jgi:hypothetical protein
MCRKSKSRRKQLRAAIRLSVLVLAWVTTSQAQVTIGENVNLQMTGSLGYGYSGAFGNSGLSTNSSGLTGNADLTGSYFHPNFLSFSFRPFLNRNKSNTDSQTVTLGRGYGGSVGIFSGSRFPGSISFGQGFASNTEFRVAGVPSLSGDSTNRNFGIGWSALVPGLPQLTANFTSASGSATFFETSKSSNSSKNFDLNSSYTIGGFDLMGHYSWNNNRFTSPDIFTVEETSSANRSKNLSVTAHRNLFLHGGLSLGWSRSSSEGDTGSRYSTSSYSVGTSFNPWSRFSVYHNLIYTTNLTAALIEETLGGANAGLNIDRDSNGTYNALGATYNIGHGFTATGRYSHRVQNFSGRTYDNSQYGGSLNYSGSGRLLGLFYFGIGMVDTASKNGNDGLGFNGVIGMNRKVKGWETSADFNYSHNVQTLTSIVNTSTYSYGSNARRKLTDELGFGMGFRASHSGMVAQSGDGNRSESFNASLNWRRYRFSGAYSQSSGSAVLNARGELTPTPIGSILTPDFMLYDARSYSFSASTLLMRRIRLTGAYSRYQSESEKGEESRLSNGNRISLRTEYRMRKFNLLSGYQRSDQEVSSIPGGPRIVNSYYVSISRWINVF